MKLKYLFVAFFRAGMLGYGGGLSAIPLMYREVVIIYVWMDDEEFSDVLALANTLPGPINTKLSGYIGYRVAGIPGMLISLFATVIPTAFLMVLFLSVLNTFKDTPWVTGMAKGVLPVAGVMIGVLAWDFLKLSHKTMGIILTIVFTVVSIIVMEVLNIHPAILVAAIILIAVSPRGKQNKKKRDRQVDNP